MKDVQMKLTVVGSRIENKRRFIIVKYQGVEYDVLAYPFQDLSKFPAGTELECMVGEKDNSIKIHQALSVLFSQLYTVGNVYPFRVKEHVDNYYTIMDKYGFVFRLTEYQADNIFVGKSIHAELLKLDGVKSYFKQVCEEHQKVSGLTFWDKEFLVNKLNIDEELIDYVLSIIRSDAAYEEISDLYNSKDGHWILELLIRLDSLILDSENTNERIIPVFKELCIYLLEKSNLLKRFDNDERKDWLKKLSRVAIHCEDYQMAYDLIHEGKEKAFIDEQISNLSDAEYLYQPERKLRTIICIFNENEQLMSDKMDELFDVISKGNIDNWMADPFRTAYVDMLQLFIDEYHEKANRNYDSLQGASIVGKLVRALAIQLCLSNHIDDIDRRLNRSMLYRFLACTNVTYLPKTYASALLNKSFECLFLPYEEELEFDLRDCSSVESLFLAACDSMRFRDLHRSNIHQRYSGNNIELLINNGNIIIQPVVKSSRPIDVLPDSLQRWNNIKVCLNEPPRNKVRDPKDINKFSLLCSEIERSITEVKSSIAYYTKGAKRLPSVDDDVLIRVIDTDEDYRNLYCEIVDEDHKGHGWMALDDVVRYIHPADNLKGFFANANGEPYIIPAHVIQGPDNNGEVDLSMAEEINNFIFDNTSVGDILVCRISSLLQGFGLWLGVAENGASCIVKPKGEQLRPGEYVRVVVQGREERRGQLKADFLEHAYQDTFETTACFRKLMSRLSEAYTQGMDFDDEEELNEEPMSRETAIEIIEIIDRLAVLSESREQIFCYLAICSILSQMINHKFYTDYYAQRKQFISIFYEYEQRGQLPQDKMDVLKSSVDRALLMADPYIAENFTKLRIIEILSQNEGFDELLAIKQSAKSESLRNAADLAISLILTSRFGMTDVRKMLSGKIYEELHVQPKMRDRKNYGMERQDIEFKTSIVYPSNNRMRAAKHIQGREIMKVICGFLNSATGGTLYLGVNDEGVATGLSADFLYLDVNKDGFDRYVRNMINRTMGTMANACVVETAWEKDEGYDVYKLRFRPSRDLVFLEGECWLRQGTEKRVLSAEKQSKYAEDHIRDVVRYEQDHQQEKVVEAPKPTLEDYQEIKPSEPVERQQPTIPTSRWRENHSDNYSKEYMAAAFLHILPNSQYMITDDPLYEDVLLTLSIEETESDGYIVVAYKSGKVALISTEELLNMQRNTRYIRCKADEPVFICPMCKTDGVLTAYENSTGDTYIRIDTPEELIGMGCEGRMGDDGAHLSEVKIKEFLGCEVVRNSQLNVLHRYRRSGEGLGQKLERQFDIQQLEDELNLKL